MVSFVPHENIREGAHSEFTSARDAPSQPGFIVQLSKEAEIRPSNQLEFSGQVFEPLDPEWRSAHPIVLLEARERNRDSARKEQRTLRKDALAVAEVPTTSLIVHLSGAYRLSPAESG